LEPEVLAIERPGGALPSAVCSRPNGRSESIFIFDFGLRGAKICIKKIK